MMSGWGEGGVIERREQGDELGEGGEMITPPGLLPPSPLSTLPTLPALPAP